MQVQPLGDAHTILSSGYAGRLRVTLITETAAAERTETNTAPLSRLIFFNFAGEKDRPIKSRHKAALVFFERLMRQANISGRDQQRMLDTTKISPLHKQLDIKEDVFATCEQAMANYPNLANEAARALVLTKLGVNIERPHFRPLKVDKEHYVFDTNIDLRGLNNGESDRSKWLLSEESVLTSLFEMQMDLALSAKFDAGLVTVDSHAQLFRSRTGDLVRKVMKTSDNAQLFSDIVLNDLKSVHDAINGGARSFDDFMSILREADKFKQWISNGLRNISASFRTVHTYCRQMATRDHHRYLVQSRSSPRFILTQTHSRILTRHALA